MKYRVLGPVVLFSTLCLGSSRLFAAANNAGSGEAILDAQALSHLEQRALEAKPREQCFLYAELVHGLTELAGKQLLAGQADEASASLKRVDKYAQQIHMGLADDSKRLKNAELLMHHTTRKLGDILHAASGEDRDVLQDTLKKLNQVQDELLTQVFRH